MDESLASRGFQYAVYLTEGGVLAFMLFRGHWRRLAVVFLYLAALLAIDGVGRPYVLYRFGLHSHEYAYFFWLTDVLLALAAFVLMCTFFRRACRQEEKMWRFLRLLLAFVFILVLGLSSFSLLRHYNQLFTIFIVEFQQNLYFTCLVLNTLLFILLQQIQDADQELELLVCGMGLQFAAPAAGLALFYLTAGADYSKSVCAYVHPLCTLGMLLTWLYAVARTPKSVVVKPLQENASRVADAPSEA